MDIELILTLANMLCKNGGGMMDKLMTNIRGSAAVLALLIHDTTTNIVESLSTTTKQSYYINNIK